MNKARAAQIWAQLERFLIERCGLPDGRMLERDRPELIRAIGKALTGRAAAAKSVSPPLPQQDAYAKRIKMRLPEVRKSAQTSEQECAKVRKSAQMRPDTIHDPRLAAMLERSCSRRMGYDGDDAVDYGER
jgi:hypothetical protein